MDYKQIDEHSAVIRTLKENDIKIKPKGYSMYPLLEKECIHGKLIAVERNGRMFSVNNIVYRFISYVWLLLRPVRMPVAKSAAAVKRCIKKMVKRNGKEQ